MIILILLLLHSLTPPGAVPHDYFVSYTTITQDGKTGILQIHMKMAGHDLEKYFEKKNIKISLDDSNNTKNQEYISKWMSAHFKMYDGSSEMDYNFLGYEINAADELEFFAETTYSLKTNSLKVSNTLLLDLFPLQENIIHLELNGKKTQTGYCTQQHKEQIFNF
jgi:hypothetical protein